MNIGSMSLGIFDWLVSWIGSFVGTVVGWVFDIIMGIINRVIFNFVKQILFIVDWCQTIFRKLAGTDSYFYVEGGKGVKQEGDILFKLMSDATVLQVLLALSLVAVFMTIIATIIKVVQSEFTTEGSKNSKGGIIGDAIKSFVKFAMVPLLCVGGVFLSNILLNLLDRATSLGGADSMASQIFVSAASSANKSRNGLLSGSDSVQEFLRENGLLFNNSTNDAQTASAIDMAFRSQLFLKGNTPATGGGIVDMILTTALGALMPGGNALMILNLSTTALDTIISGPQVCATYQNLYMVSTFYEIGHINMIIMIGGSLVACYVMLITSFGLVMRLFKAVILFMISPPVIAIAPLDKGNAFSSWRKQFIAEVLGAYGAVLGLNLFFIVLPLINNINLFGLSGSGGASFIGENGGIDSVAGGYGGNILDDMAHLLFTIVGLYMVKDLIKMISGIAGGTNATSEGEGMAKKAGQTALKAGTLVAGVATGGAGLAMGKAFGAIGGKLLAKNAGSKAGQRLTSMGKGLTKVGTMGKNQAQQSGAYFAGMVGKAGNNLVGDGTFNEKQTMDDREKYAKEKKVALGKKGSDELSFTEVLNPLRRQAVKEAKTANDQAVTEDESQQTKKQTVINNAQAHMNSIQSMLNKTGLKDEDVAKMRVEIEAQLAKGDFAEDEQSQQLLRTMVESLKKIETASSVTERSKTISSAKNSASAMETTLQASSAEVGQKIKILGNIQTATSGQKKISPEEYSNIIAAQVATELGKSTTDPEVKKKIKEIESEMKAILDKKSE